VVAREETEERDEAAFTADLLEAMEAAFRVVRALGLSPEETADVLQDASIRAWRHRGKRRGAFRPWFLTIAYREARRPRRRWLTVPAFWVAGDDAGAASASLERVAGALRELPRRQRAAISLRYDGDLTISGVARVMRISEPAAKQLLARARDTLRRMLADASEETSR